LFAFRFFKDVLLQVLAVLESWSHWSDFFGGCQRNAFGGWCGWIAVLPFPLAWVWINCLRWCKDREVFLFVSVGYQ